MTYGAETGIPEDAELAVEEILPGDSAASGDVAAPGDSAGSADDADTSSAYDEYIAKTENVLGWEAGSVS